MDSSRPELPESSKHVARTLRALELLAESSLSQGELARALRIHPRTARRLLNALVADGYAMRDAGARTDFTATLKLAALSGRVIERLDLARVAEPFVSRLAVRTRQTVRLGVPGDGVVVQVIEEGSDEPPNRARPNSTTAPYHASAMGKVLLAHTPSQVTRVFERALERFTEHTIVDPADLLVDLARVREQGYATDDLEWQPGIRGVAAPVFDYTGSTWAAISVEAPGHEFTDERLAEAGASVVETAHSLSEVLGFGPARRQGQS